MESRQRQSREAATTPGQIRCHPEGCIRNRPVSKGHSGDYDSVTASDMDEMLAANKSIADRFRASRRCSSSTSDYDDEVFSLPPSSVLKSRVRSLHQRGELQKQARAENHKALKYPPYAVMATNDSGGKNSGINRLDNEFGVTFNKFNDSAESRPSSQKMNVYARRNPAPVFHNGELNSTVPLYCNNKMNVNKPSMTPIINAKNSAPRLDPQTQRFQPQQNLTKRRSVLNISTSKLVDNAVEGAKPILQRPASAHFEWVSSLSGSQFLPRIESENRATTKASNSGRDWNQDFKCFSASNLSKVQPLAFSQPLSVPLSLRDCRTQVSCANKLNGIAHPGGNAQRGYLNVMSVSTPKISNCLTTDSSSDRLSHPTDHNEQANNFTNQRLRRLPPQSIKHSFSQSLVNTSSANYHSRTPKSELQFCCEKQMHVIAPSDNYRLQKHKPMLIESPQDRIPGVRRENFVLSLVPERVAHHKVEQSLGSIHNKMSSNGLRPSDPFQVSVTKKIDSQHTNKTQQDNEKLSSKSIWVNDERGKLGTNQIHMNQLNHLESPQGIKQTNSIPRNYAVNKIINITKNKCSNPQPMCTIKQQPSTLILQRPWTIHVCDDEEAEQIMCKPFSYL